MSNTIAYTYEPSGHGINKFHALLMRHPKLQGFSGRTWTILLHGLRFAEKAHFFDARKNELTPYITHPIEMILEYLDQVHERSVSCQDILVLALHDVLEEHPERWRVLLNLFDGEVASLEIFRDILVLSTGGFSQDIRSEMIRYFYGKYKEILTLHHAEITHHSTGNLQNLVGEILRILNPVHPLFKQNTESSFREGTVEFQKIRNAIRLYRDKVLIQKKKISPEELEKSEEYIGLGNYIYFTPIDASRKLRDMIHNMQDMETMELKKPGYTETRRIKAYILGVILKIYGMQDEYSRLEAEFQKRGNINMLTDAAVVSMLQN